ncbi:MAG: inosine monophosphate cyclohydrolase [Ruminococcaceae bacterium]|nr:inosine monophosphate cyclohydrolase [Oscillospiraceae bacterium]
MKQFSPIEALLKKNSYPGRGIVIGRSEDAKSMVVVYFIMGRSENSRNRIFVTDGDGIRTQAFDSAKLTDPSLIIYHPVRVLDGATIVTNGDQTDTIQDFLRQGKTFGDALRTRTFEPDAPNFTPRISGLVQNSGYRLSILKSADGDSDFTRRFFYEYDGAAAGTGHFIHTYRCDGSPIPSFSGEPEEVSLKGGIDALSSSVWESLNQENKVSLFIRFISLADGTYETRIINKNH